MREFVAEFSASPEAELAIEGTVASRSLRAFSKLLASVTRPQ
jgi:hypothetical protein